MRLKHDPSTVGGNPDDCQLGSAVGLLANLGSNEQGLGQVPERHEGLRAIELVSTSHPAFESRLHRAWTRAVRLGDTERARQLRLWRKVLQGSEIPRRERES